MKTDLFLAGKFLRNLRSRAMVTMTIALVLGVPLVGRGAAPTPLVDLAFTEAEGAFTFMNAGSLGGSAFLWQGDGTEYPMLRPLVPQGPFAPSNNARSIDMGPIEEAQGNRAIDLATDLGVFGSLGGFTSFTLTGWINARDLNAGSGGNRVLFALDSPGGLGFDLVQMANGSLQLGVNQWPDGSPAVSSVGKVTADPALGADNWVYFAVTYDSALESGHVNFYFGAGDTLASLDSTHTYPRGAVEQTGELTLGNFGIAAPGVRAELGPNGPSRVFRGLIDEVKVYDSVLELAAIQYDQLGGVVPPDEPATIIGQPESQTVFPGQRATFQVGVTGSAPIFIQWQTNGVDVAGATAPTLTLTGITRSHDGLEVRVLVNNAGTTDLLSETVTLTVIDVTEASLVTEGIVLRLDASALELEDGAAVAQWPDLSSAGKHAVQEDELARPMFVAEGSTFGMPVVRFSAVSPYPHMRVENMGPHNPPNTIFLVWKINENTGGDQQPLDGLSDPTRVRIGYQANPSRIFGWSGGSFPNLEKAMAVPFEELILTTAVFDTGGGLFRVDGVTEDQRATGDIAITGFTIGRRFTEAQPLAGDIAEVIVYDRRLSDSEINMVEGYLFVKWLTDEGLEPGPVDRPQIEVLTMAENIVFSWEAPGPFQLQARDQLTAGEWVDVTVEPIVEGSRRTVTLPVEAGVRFFRLRSP
jgi:hypothetical protein